MENVQTYLDGLLKQAMDFAPKIALAILSILIGFWIANRFAGIISKKLKTSKVDKDLHPFVVSLVGVGIKVLVIISVAGFIGIQTTSFVAVIGAATLAVGMALQGSLGNFASGVMILIFKPYRVDDLVDVQGQLGTVDEIQIFNTIITTLDNKKVIIPNSVATSGIITNLSATEYLRVDLNAAMPFEEDFEKVRKIILEAIAATPKVLQSPAPVVEIEKFGEHSVVIAVRPFATVADYWDVYFGVYRNMKKALGEAGIKVPYPRRDVTNLN
jgi:small conductance mechanosensitive channel